jgi:cold shock CspA family protein
MTGRIKSLGDAGTSGFITAENGHSFHFESSAVLAYDAACLAVGQTVSFELESSGHHKVFNVCVQRPHLASRAPVKQPESVHVRYTGFEQTGNIRAYRFERLSTGEETQAFLVTADLSLFMKHHVGIQEGPTLCLHVLMTHLADSDPVRQAPLRRVLTDVDLLAHVASRPVPSSKGRHKVLPRPLATPTA